ncbi:MAG: hypothetical protein QOF35_1703, partial [Actinomycetota bacterium]|nr:hypothetical protein [Actinomycetota bacterium]
MGWTKLVRTGSMDDSRIAAEPIENHLSWPPDAVVSTLDCTLDASRIRA